MTPSLRRFFLRADTKKKHPSRRLGVSPVRPTEYTSFPRAESDPLTARIMTGPCVNFVPLEKRKSNFGSYFIVSMHRRAWRNLTVNAPETDFNPLLCALLCGTEYTHKTRWGVGKLLWRRRMPQRTPNALHRVSLETLPVLNGNVIVIAHVIPCAPQNRWIFTDHPVRAYLCACMRFRIKTSPRGWTVEGSRYVVVSD